MMQLDWFDPGTRLPRRKLKIDPQKVNQVVRYTLLLLLLIFQNPCAKSNTHIVESKETCLVIPYGIALQRISAHPYETNIAYV